MFQTGNTIGPYTLVRELGQGAFGIVWLGERRNLITTQFALKLPQRGAVDLEDIKREATLWREAGGHPNVLPLFEAAQYDDHIVIVSEYAPDGSLQLKLDESKDKPFTVEEAVDLISGVLAGLEHLHKKRILHQDLKPANILMQGESPRLADFGIAGLLNSKSYLRGFSGTLAYMSPEAFDEKRSVQSDIWAAGVIFYQLLTGNLPFPQREVASLIGAITRYDPQPLPPSVPEAVRKVVGQALQKEPALRYKSATAMRSALRIAVQSSIPITNQEIQTIKALPPKVPAPDPVVEMPDKLTDYNPVVTLVSEGETKPVPDTWPQRAQEAQWWRRRSNLAWLVLAAVTIIGLATAAGFQLLGNRGAGVEQVEPNRQNSTSAQSPTEAAKQPGAQATENQTQGVVSNTGAQTNNLPALSQNSATAANSATVTNSTEQTNRPAQQRPKARSSRSKKNSKEPEPFMRP